MKDIIVTVISTGTLWIIFQFVDAFKKSQHDGVHLVARLTRISNKLHRF